MNKKISASLILLGALPFTALAQQSTTTSVGPNAGDREFSISGTGSSDDDFDNSSFGIVADLGWYRSENTVWGIRQSLNYADIEGEGLTDDFWNGSTRGYFDYNFGSRAFRPFLGASLGYIYGDGVDDDFFAGLETGARYYVLDNTYILGRAEYQWFFDGGSDVDDAFDDGAWAFSLGVGFNF